jgi:CRP-like cAMP-binding protein
MPLDWLNTPLDADIGELIAKKKRAKAIETLRRQLQGRLAPPVAVRLQLADLLMQAGRVEEAVPVLLGLSDEFAGDGFVAKAVAILKRVDRVQPGRPDIAERLEKLVHQQKRVSNQPASSRRPLSTPELGMEELGMEELASGGLATPMGFEEAVELPAEALPAEIEVEALSEGSEPEIAPEELQPAPEPEAAVEPEPEPEAALEPEPMAARAAEPEPKPEPEAKAEPELPAEPVVDAVAEDAPAVAEPRPSVEVEPAAETSPVAAEEPSPIPDPSAPPPETTAEAPEGEAAGPGVGRRIRRALWRFLSSLPGAEEGGLVDPPNPTDPMTPAEPTMTEATEAAVIPDVAAEASPIALAPVAADAAPVETTPAEPSPEPPPPSPEAVEAEDPLLAVLPAAPEHEAMSEEAFRQNLLDIVEDVLHRPPPPASTQSADRARVLDLAGRLVASRLFKDLSDEELLAIVRGLRLHTFEPGEIVVTEGEIGQSLFTLAAGRVKVFVANPDRRNFEVAVLTEGDFFGEISSLSGRPRTATVVAASVCELLELDRPTLDSIARTHARVRDVLESSYIERASSPEAAAVRAVPLPDAGTRRKAIEVLESHFGESRWDPRMRLRLADILLKAGKDEDAIPILIGLADELAREGFADKAVAIIKKIEQVQRRNVEVVNLAPLFRPAPASSSVAAAGAAAEPRSSVLRPRAITDDRFHGWLVDVVRDTVGSPRTSSASESERAGAGMKGYRPGLLANPLFEGFTEEELVALIGGLKLLSFDPGDVIVTEGESGQSVFILSTGEVKVFVRGPGHRSVMIGTLGEGSFFGEISTLSGRPRTATVTAAVPCEILELDRAALEAIAADHPRVREVLETFSAARSADPDVARARGERPSV